MEEELKAKCGSVRELCEENERLKVGRENEV